MRKEDLIVNYPRDNEYAYSFITFCQDGRKVSSGPERLNKVERTGQIMNAIAILCLPMANTERENKAFRRSVDGQYDEVSMADFCSEFLNA